MKFRFQSDGKTRAGLQKVTVRAWNVSRPQQLLHQLGTFVHDLLTVWWCCLTQRPPVLQNIRIEQKGELKETRSVST